MSIWRLNWIEPNDLFFIPFNYSEYDIIPFKSTWNMVKDIPNHIPDNMIG